MKNPRRFLIFAIILFMTAGLYSGQGEILALSKPSREKTQTSSTVRVTVLFFNDLHGNLKPFKIKKDDGSSVDVGGIAGISALVKKIREENRNKGIKTFVLVAGDVLQGTPMSTVFQGKPDIEIFNAMGVSVMTVGNHEFDFGLDNFLELKKMAKFPLISSNIIWKDTRKLMNEPSVGFPLSDGVTLTVIGATTTELLTTTAPANVAKVDVLDSISTVTEHFTRAASRGPVILLSHSKFQTDSDIARANTGLTAIIGGHDQILFDPYKVASGVPVFQAFEKGRYLGRLDISYDPKTRKSVIYRSQYIPITSDLRQDPAVVKLLTDFSARLDATFRQVVGESLVFMDGERGRIRYEETNLGDFVSDVMREYTGSDAACINAGSLRSSLDKGPVTIEGIFKVMPYPNEIIVVKLSGADILEALNRSVQGTREDEDGGFLHVSGIKFKIKIKKAEEIVIGGAALDPEKIYSITITDFMYSGGDGYKIFVNKTATKTGLPLRELLVDTIRKKGKISAEVEGRITRE
jgi:5'-nucleotidase / UDP-sugar diphosphatase